jgi:type II secretory pathway component PulF
MQKAQTGQVQHYAMFMLAGVIAVIIIAMVLP